MATPPRSSSGLLPVVAAVAGGYVQNAVARRLGRRVGGGFVRRTVVSIFVSWLMGKAVRSVQAAGRRA